MTRSQHPKMELLTDEQKKVRCATCHQPCGYDMKPNRNGDMVHAHGCPPKRESARSKHAKMRRDPGSTRRALITSALQLLDTENSHLGFRRAIGHEGDICAECQKPILEGTPMRAVYIRNSGALTGTVFHSHHFRL